jgi:SnoaL-like domain
MNDQGIRSLLDRYWSAASQGNADIEYALYDTNAVLEYPQSGERTIGRANIRASREHHPAKRAFTIRRIRGHGDLWITEYVITYDGKPFNTVSIMKFRDSKVAHETQYFAEPFEAPAWRSPWVEHSAVPPAAKD